MGSLGGIIAGLVGSGQGESTIDLGQLLSTIQNAGQYQRSIINSLPQNIQANLAAYANSMNNAGSTLQGDVTNQGNNFLQQIKGLYGPNSAAAQTQKQANTVDAYANVPGTQNAIRNALAATGGLQRGQAGVALAQPYVTAANTASRANMGVNAQQTAAGQQATQQALTIVNSMDSNMFQQLFGMSQAQAAQILQSGNQALQTQLADLITQSNTETGQTLGAEGIEAQNAYQNALQQRANQNAIYTGLGNFGVQGMGMMFSPGAFAGTSGGGMGINGVGSEYGFTPDVTSSGYQANNAAMAAAMGY